MKNTKHLMNKHKAVHFTAAAVLSPSDSQRLYKQNRIEHFSIRQQFDWFRKKLYMKSQKNKRKLKIWIGLAKDN